ncbi:hypothetical protein FRAHR75_240042 [Frankia sp. Hr75.2]|nr:hypothetical protein FRAHR75_240042 [Frankia sp. Hr75.2]
MVGGAGTSIIGLRTGSLDGGRDSEVCDTGFLLPVAGRACGHRRHRRHRPFRIAGNILSGSRETKETTECRPVRRESYCEDRGARRRPMSAH